NLRRSSASRGADQPISQSLTGSRCVAVGKSIHLTGAVRMRTMPRALKIATLLIVASSLLLRRGAAIHAQSPAISWDGMIEHVTEAPNYIGNPDGNSYLPRHAMSADGRYVVF